MGTETKNAKFKENKIGEMQKKFAEVSVKPMVLKPNQDDVGALGIGVLTRGRANCAQCGTAHHDGIHPAFFLRYQQLTMPLNTQISQIVVSGHKIPDARNEMMRVALAQGCKYLLTMDDDMIIEPHIVHHMYQRIKMYPDAGIFAAWSVSKAAMFREPFVYIDEDLGGGAWYGIVEEYNRLKEKHENAMRKQQQGQALAPEEVWNPDIDIKPFEIEAIGTGVMIIDLKWAKKICNPSPEPCAKDGQMGHGAYCPYCAEGGPWFKEGIDKAAGGGNRVWGQDIWFCKQIRKVGGKILVDPTLFVPHLDVNTDIVYGPPTKWETQKPQKAKTG